MRIAGDNQIIPADAVIALATPLLTYPGSQPTLAATTASHSPGVRMTAQAAAGAI